MAREQRTRSRGIDFKYSAICQTRNCDVLNANDADSLYALALAHHTHNIGEGLVIGLFGSGRKTENHRCRDFVIVCNENDQTLGKWHFAHGQFSDRWSNAVFTDNSFSQHVREARDPAPPDTIQLPRRGERGTNGKQDSVFR